MLATTPVLLSSPQFLATTTTGSSNLPEKTSLSSKRNSPPSDFIQLLSSEFQTLYSRISSRFDQWAALKRKEISEKRAQHRASVAEMTGEYRMGWGRMGGAEMAEKPPSALVGQRNPLF